MLQLSIEKFLESSVNGQGAELGPYLGDFQQRLK
jgi:hypothetical protein